MWRMWNNCHNNFSFSFINTFQPFLLKSFFFRFPQHFCCLKSTLWKYYQQIQEREQISFKLIFFLVFCTFMDTFNMYIVHHHTSNRLKCSSVPCVPKRVCGTLVIDTCCCRRCCPWPPYTLDIVHLHLRDTWHFCHLIINTLTTLAMSTIPICRNLSSLTGIWALPEHLLKII